MRLISAVFKNVGDEMYVSSRTLLDYGFENFKSITAITFLFAENMFFKYTHSTPYAHLCISTKYKKPKPHSG